MTCKPDIREHKRNKKDDQFLIVACDGIWDCKSNEQCVNFLNEKIPSCSIDEMNKPVEDLLDDCCAVNSDEGIGTDNMTAILIKFKNNET